MDDVGWVVRDHPTKYATTQELHGFAAKASGQHTIESRRRAATLQVPEDDRSPQQREQEKAQKQRQATLTEILARAGQHYRQQLKGNPRAIEYLKGRGLTGQIALQFGLGYAPDGWRSLASAFPSYDDPLLVETGLVILQDDPGKSEAEQRRYDRFRDRVMFPIRNVLGEVIGFGGRVLDKGEPKYLNSPETPVFHKGKELYGLYEARPAMRRRRQVGQRCRQFGAGRGRRRVGAGHPVDRGDVHRAAVEVVGDVAFDGVLRVVRP